MAKKKKNAPFRDPEKALAWVRDVIAEWPETSEKLSHGSPTFWGGRKTFVSFHDGHHDDGRLGIWIKHDKLTQAGVVEMDPARFYIPPYVGPSGWIGARLDVPSADLEMIRDLMLDGYRMVAPKRALKKLAELEDLEEDE